ncbi:MULTISPECIES: hypothetical protein [Methanobacterium]|jgi:predicted HicB family RNase H-like nuclease|uniref:CopG family transcriptional regulator n=1 Tax=Methanobacterium formicicum TaxID=2162 RepID=A0A0S4FPH2_METFO|nr:MULTISPECIES: hypothetical protein [Methanobacterium]MBF4475283.1 hypothetical protein [Methanobacterium formicicum]MDG3547117.1 hypothetical protein [Methanobacterium formicicum]CEL24966.1 hypothetical protein MB9_1329 [Methanobacterium formicicum]
MANPKKGEIQLNVEIPKVVKKQLYIEAIEQEISAKKLIVKYLKKGLKEDYAKRKDKGLGF